MIEQMGMDQIGKGDELEALEQQHTVPQEWSEGGGECDDENEDDDGILIMLLFQV